MTVSARGVITLFPPAVVSLVHPFIVSRACGGALRFDSDTLVFEAFEACELVRPCE